jgi:allantoin racemase
MKIMVVMGEYPPEEAERRRQATRRCASPGTEIDFSVIRGTFFARVSSQAAALTAAPLVGEAAKKAEAEGFQAVVPFGTLDVGVELARNLVRIPVVGAGQSVLHLGAQLSDRLGVITYENKSHPFVRLNMRAWGVDHFVVSMRSINVPLPDSTKQSEAMRERFLEVAWRSVDEDGAEIIVPMGVTMVPVHYSPAEFSAELGVPVLDALATSIQTAEMMVRMGAAHSVKTYPRTGA